MNEFLTFAESHGLILPYVVHGRITRCSTVTKPNKKNGAYLYEGEWGWCQDWLHHNEPVIWQSGKAQNDPAIKKKIEISKKKHREERARNAQEAAKRAEHILSRCELNKSPYLARKGFPDALVNMWQRDDETLFTVIPMRRDNKLIGCQLIFEDGEKKFLRGQRSEGAYFQIGNGSNLFYVEGYASGLSLQKVLQAIKISYRIIVAFSAGNIAYLAERQKGFIIADNDHPDKNGVKKGEKVAQESGCDWWMPPAEGYDINDWHLEKGVLKVSQELKRVIYKH